jgi:CheY-like chemotaxis protein
MVHGLAAQSGGQFLLRSTEGVGTTAELWLPVAPAGLKSPATTVPRAPEQAVESAPMLVVAVDDDALVLAGTVAMLEDLGHTVLAATSGHEAFELVMNEPKVAIVVTDQVMPRMTGIELIEKLRHARPRIPVILATGFGEAPTHLDTMALRLAKPFDQNDLAEAIRQVFAGSVSRRD